MIYEVQKFRSYDFGFEGLWIGFSGSWVSSLVLEHWIGLVLALVLGHWIGFGSSSLVLDRFCFSSWVLDRLNIILLTNLIK
ncbi:unnamed protein product [Rhizophagus irregularis]|nr:unnamed protein product [Rhizophagus irregularis]